MRRPPTRGISLAALAAADEGGTDLAARDRQPRARARPPPPAAADFWPGAGGRRARRLDKLPLNGVAVSPPPAQRGGRGGGGLKEGLWGAGRTVSGYGLYVPQILY